MRTTAVGSVFSAVPFIGAGLTLCHHSWILQKYWRSELRCSCLGALTPPTEFSPRYFSSVCKDMDYLSGGCHSRCSNKLREDSMMLQKYQSGDLHFFRVKMTQSIGLEKSANLFDFSYKYLSITWLPKNVRTVNSFMDFDRIKILQKSYKFVTKTVTPKYFYFFDPKR